MDSDDEKVPSMSATARSLSKMRETSSKRTRSTSATSGPRSTSVAAFQERDIVKSKRKLDRKIFRNALSGEADRTHYPKLVKHLNSGKRSLGTSTIGR